MNFHYVRVIIHDSREALHRQAGGGRAEERSLSTALCNGSERERLADVAIKTKHFRYWCEVSSDAIKARDDCVPLTAIYNKLY